MNTRHSIALPGRAQDLRGAGFAGPLQEPPRGAATSGSVGAP